MKWFGKRKSNWQKLKQAAKSVVQREQESWWSGSSEEDDTELLYLLLSIGLLFVAIFAVYSVYSWWKKAREEKRRKADQDEVRTRRLRALDVTALSRPGVRRIATRRDGLPHRSDWATDNGGANDTQMEKKGGGEDSLESPRRYIPPKDVSDKTIASRESVEVESPTLGWMRVNALFDTGNEKATVIDLDLAKSFGLYTEEGAFRTTRTTTLQGVVPNAKVERPIGWAKLRFRDRVFHLEVVFSELPAATPVLVGKDVINQLFSDGFSIGR